MLHMKVTCQVQPQIQIYDPGSVTWTGSAPDWTVKSTTPVGRFIFTTNKHLITEIEIISEELTNMYETFRGLGQLTNLIVPTDAFKDVTNFQRAWDGCSSLTSFPMINTSKGTTFGYAWNKCSALTSFPLLDTSSGTNFSYAWWRCSALTSFPLLDTSSGTNFSGAWGACSQLTSFPLLDTSKGTNFGYAWQSCSKLTQFPMIDTSSATSFTYAWNNCGSITSFPALDSSKVTNFALAWHGCSALICIKGIDTTSATDVHLMFGASTNICRPNATERTAIEATPGIKWISDAPETSDCCGWGIFHWSKW